MTQPTFFSRKHFNVRTTNPRKWLKEIGNIEVYSLNKSFCEEILWKFTLYPKNEDNSISGFVEKVKRNENLQFPVQEAKEALKGNFLDAQIIWSENKSPDNFELFKDKKVAFTLRVTLKEKDQLQEYENKTILGNDSSNLIQIETGIIREESIVANIRGVLTTKEILSLQECAKILASKFPSETITWLTYCTNPEAFLH